VHGEGAPSDWIVRWADAIPQGPVLDLASGRGRHARFLAARGHAVLAVDRDAEVLGTIAGVAGIETLATDLEDGRPWPLPGRRFSAIVVTNYLHRPLFDAIRASLEPGGVLLYETFMAGNERYGKPSNPKFLLAPGELWTAFEGLRVLAFDQGFVSTPKFAMIQRLVAVSGPFHARGFQ
jgi:SAM-dependent methyltransferase